MYRIFGLLGIRRIRGISVGVHAARVGVRGGGVVVAVFAGDCQPLGPGVKRLKW